MPPPEGPSAAGLLAALPVAVMVADADDRIVRANAAAEGLLQRSERAMLGRPLAEVLPPPTVERSRDGQGLAVFDAAIRTRDGATLLVDFVEAELPEHPGWRVVTLHSGAATRRFGHGPDRDGAALSAVGAAAMLAHEVRNPLSGIRGAAQLLGGNEWTRLIIAEVDRIAALIDRMQEFGDTRPLSVSAHNIYPLLDHARSLALAGFAAGIPIDEAFDPSLPPALVNTDAMVQILVNLLKNACQAVEKTGAARVTLSTAYRYGMASISRPDRPRLQLPIEICISDNGPGAAADIADHLFDPFVSGRADGQGLGLALVDKLVRDMGGIVRYAREGSPPMTVFRLLLPRAT